VFLIPILIIIFKKNSFRNPAAPLASEDLSGNSAYRCRGDSMAKVKLTYFDFPGSRGEECRVALHVAGVAFEDDRVKSADWPQKKPTTPYGGMPILEVEGHGIVAQSNAILGLIGRIHGLLPEDPFDAARHVAVLNACEDLRWRFARATGAGDDEKRAAREAFTEAHLKRWARDLDNKIVGPFFGGEAISVADIKVWGLMKFYKRGQADYVPADAFDEFEKLSALFGSVAEHPRVIDWYSRGD
jgi:glutathione S-transferase